MQAGFLLLVCTLVAWAGAFSKLNIVKNSNQDLPEIHPCDGHCTGAGQVCELSRRGKPLCLQLNDSVTKCSKGRCRSLRVCRQLNEKDDESSTFDDSIECICRRDCDKRQNAESVCGSDGKSYPSHCHLHRHACLTKTHVMIQKRGPCLPLNATINVSPKRPVTGSTISLRCNVSGDYRQIAWYRNGFPLASNDRLIVKPPGDAIIITDARVSDAGLYACRVASTEPGGFTVAFTILKVIPKQTCRTPEIVFPPSDFSYTIDSAVLVGLAPRLRDAIDAKAVGKIVQLYADRLPTQSSVVAINAVNVLEATGFLDIASALRRTRAYRTAVARVNAWILDPATKPPTLRLFGLYRVADLASASDAVRISAAIDVVTILQLETKIAFLNADALTIEKTAFGGQMVYLDCLPSSSVKSVWYRDGVPVSSATRRVQLMPGGGLWIPGFRPIDAGVYTCVATNDCGRTARSGTIAFVESGTFTNARFDSLLFADAALANVTFANATIRRLELRNVVATNVTFSNVIVETLIASDAVLKQLRTKNVSFSNVVIRNVSFVDATHTNVTFVDYTTINTTLTGVTWNDAVFVNATEINATRVDTTLLHSRLIDYREIGSTVVNSTKNDCYVKNYTAANVTTLNSAAHNVTVVDATMTDCKTTNGFDIHVRLASVVFTRCAETEVRRHDSSIAASRYVGYSAVGVVSDHSVFNGVDFVDSTFIDVAYEHASLCDVKFARSNAHGLVVEQSQLSFVSFVDSSVVLGKPLQNVRYYELDLPGLTAVSNNPDLVYDPTLKDCRGRVGHLDATCRSGEVKVTSSCGPGISLLTCPSGKVVEVNKALYSGQRGKVDKGKNSKCSLDVSSKLKNHCEGKSPCLVLVSDAFLGKFRCSSKQKCLTVSYCCAGDPRLLLKTAVAPAASKSSKPFGLPSFFHK